jgi:hypothetical protein
MNDDEVIDVKIHSTLIRSLQKIFDLRLQFNKIADFSVLRRFFSFFEQAILERDEFVIFCVKVCGLCSL